MTTGLRQLRSRSGATTHAKSSFVTDKTDSDVMNAALSKGKPTSKAKKSSSKQVSTQPQVIPDSDSGSIDGTDPDVQGDIPIESTSVTRTSSKRKASDQEPAGHDPKRRTRGRPAKKANEEKRQTAPQPGQATRSSKRALTRVSPTTGIETERSDRTEETSNRITAPESAQSNVAETQMITDESELEDPGVEDPEVEMLEAVQEENPEEGEPSAADQQDGDGSASPAQPDTASVPDLREVLRDRPKRLRLAKDAPTDLHHVLQMAMKVGRGLELKPGIVTRLAPKFVADCEKLERDVQSSRVPFLLLSEKDNLNDTEQVDMVHAWRELIKQSAGIEKQKSSGIARDLYAHIIPSLTKLLGSVYRHLRQLSAPTLIACQTLYGIVQTIVSLGRHGELLRKNIRDLGSTVGYVEIEGKNRQIVGFVHNGIVAPLKQFEKVMEKLVRTIYVQEEYEQRKQEAEAAQRLRHEQNESEGRNAEAQQRQQEELDRTQQEEIATEARERQQRTNAERRRAHARDHMLEQQYALEQQWRKRWQDLHTVRSFAAIESKAFVLKRSYGRDTTADQVAECIDELNAEEGSNEAWSNELDEVLLNAMHDKQGQWMWEDVIFDLCRGTPKINGGRAPLADFSVTEIVSRGIVLRNWLLNDLDPEEEEWVSTIDDPRLRPILDNGQ